MKKLLKSIVIILTIFFLLSPISFCSDNIDFKQQIKKEEGSLFEKTIAECIGSIAQTIFDFSTSEELGIGFKDYDELIFNKNTEKNYLSPFTTELWNKTMDWYKIFSTISGSLILISIIILSYKIIAAGMNTSKKNEAKESMMRLLFGAFAISLAPLFIKFLLFLNNSLVDLLVITANSSIDGLLGNDMLSSIKTGNAITTALVISMFIYLFVKLNIKFIVRQFTIIVFTIFTPVACALWINNKNVTAASIWAGQIIMNIFMQFIYCFLFLIYLAFLPSGGGWAISLIWAMMILPLADALQNCLQNLTSRIAGIDNEQMANRALGVGAMLGYSVGAIKEQFKTPESTIKSTNYNNDNVSSFLGRVKNVTNPHIKVNETSNYNEYNKPIKEFISKDEQLKQHKTDSIINTNTIKNNISTIKSITGNIAKGSYNATKSYLKVGANLVEGKFDNPKNSHITTSPTSKYNKNFETTEYANTMNNLIHTPKGDEDELN